MKFSAIAEQIIKLKDRDLTLRSSLLQKGELGNGYHEEMQQMHNENAKALNDIIDAIGYPTIDKVGKEGCEAAWLVIQHAIGQPAFMKKCAILLEIAVAENRADPIQLAYLTDRIAVFEGKPQSFGTQFDWDEKGEMNPQEYDDLESVNQLRKSIGLNTLEEQTQIMRAGAKKENESPPVDFVKRKAEIDQWRKAVGWKE